MGLKTPPVSLSRYHARVGRALNKTLDQLGSGKRVRKASDNPATSAILKRLEAHERALSAAEQNTQDARSVADTLDGAMNHQQALLTRMRELSVRASNGTLTDDQRRMVQNEFEGLRSDLDRVANNTKLGGASLFSGGNFEIQVGATAGPDSQISLEVPQTSASVVGLGTAEVGTAFGATSSIEMIDRAIEHINESRAAVGSTHNRMGSASDFLQKKIEQYRATQSQMGDTDFAEATGKLALQKFQMRAKERVMQIQNQQRGQLLNLLA